MQTASYGWWWRPALGFYLSGRSVCRLQKATSMWCVSPCAFQVHIMVLVFPFFVLQHHVHEAPFKMLARSTNPGSTLCPYMPCIIQHHTLPPAQWSSHTFADAPQKHRVSLFALSCPSCKVPFVPMPMLRLCMLVTAIYTDLENECRV